MALPNVSITLANGGLGQVIPNEDGVSGIVFNGVAASGLALGVSKQGFSLADFEALGITKAYDTTNSVGVWRHISDFYTEAGNGSELWLMLVSQATSMATILDKTTNNAKKLLSDAAGRIRLLGVVRYPGSGYTPSTATNQMDADVLAALTNGQVLADEQRSIFAPVSIVVEGYAYTGTASGLPDLKLRTNPNLSVLIGDKVSGPGAAIGLLLGRLAADPVQRNPGRVKSGALPIDAAYLGTATIESAPTSSGAIHNKCFITLRTFPGRAGYYFSDAPTADLVTSDYNLLPRVRIINKVIRITYQTYVNEILDEILIDAQGRIETVQAKYYQEIIATQINTAMTANGEISSVTAFVDTEQNILSTGKFCVSLEIVPVGYSNTIEVKLGFNNPAL
jgi:Protein of unknown function (DUF2586)